MAPSPQDTTSQQPPEPHKKGSIKRKRETPASRAASKANKTSKTSTPNAYSRRSPPRETEPKPISDDEGEKTPPRKLKRPGGGARVPEAARQAAERDRREREEQERRAISMRSGANADLVVQHYNSVPERGRDWRSTQSRIKGLRSLNNWIKSTLIQKFSLSEQQGNKFTVLDMACGKGGDLGKWDKAPRRPNLYVGCDIADQSIEQARARDEDNRRRRRGPAQMESHFYVRDTFNTSLGELPIVRQVGFDDSAGPGNGAIQGRMMPGGFDVVSMMFALHYSFENEESAKGMLKNVAACLKKGGRFIGCMPNADLISAQVKKLLNQEVAGKTANGKEIPGEGAKSPEDDKHSEEGEVDDWDPEKSADTNGAAAEGDDDDDWDPEKPSEPQENAQDDDDDNWDPEKPTEPSKDDTEQTDNIKESAAQSTKADEQNLEPLKWGNELYSVTFPRQQPLVNKNIPRNGVFRPPFGWKYTFHLEEAVDAPEYVVPFETLRALAEDYGLELMYRKNFGEVYADEVEDRELGMLAERMGVRSRDRSMPRGGLLVSEEEMEIANFYCAFVFYKV
ncbi:hypothetical protein MBLNU230_g2919t1 [Neophaeotheca triangularis]